MLTYNLSINPYNFYFLRLTSCLYTHEDDNYDDDEDDNDDDGYIIGVFLCRCGI